MGTPATRFEDLGVWQKAHPFGLNVYRLTRMFPRSGIYGLSSQFRRAAVSIAANIAGGFKTRGKADQLRYCNFAQGPIEESRYYPILAEDLPYGDVDEWHRLLEAVGKPLEAYSRAIVGKGAAPTSIKSKYSDFFPIRWLRGFKGSRGLGSKGLLSNDYSGDSLGKSL